MANGEEPSAAEEAAALAAKEAKGGTIKFGWVKGVLVSLRLQSKLVTEQFLSVGSIDPSPDSLHAEYLGCDALHPDVLDCWAGRNW